MADLEALRHALTEYADALVRHYDIGDVLDSLTEHAVAVLDVDCAGVFLAEDGDRLVLVCGTDERVSELEHLQLERGEGPCHDAFRTAEPVRCADLDAETRWSTYAAAAVEAGYRSVAGVPMPVGDTAIGALNLYRRAPGPWPEEELATAVVLAKMAAGYVVNARALEETRTLSRQLQGALESRVVIEQAKGILAERRGVDVNVAFDLLRRQSRRTNTRLHELCRRVIAGAELDD